MANLPGMAKSRGILPYLLHKAKGGDMDARACIKSMADDDGDDDAREALDSLDNDDDNDGNGASADDAMDKGYQGQLFDLDALDASLRELEPFAKSEDAPHIPGAADTLGGRPEIQAAAALDAGDFVKAMVDGNVQALDRLGDGVLWNASATEALAKSQIAQGEIMHNLVGLVGSLSSEIGELRKALTTTGAGLRGVQTAAQLATVRAQPRVAREAGGAPPAPKASELEDMRKALRSKRANETNSDMLASINAALEDLTVGQAGAARSILGK